MRQPRTFQKKEDKLKQLILYISQKCAAKSNFGVTKLNKIVYFSDFIFYRDTGEPITGVEYQKLQRGPAPRRMKPVIDEMKIDGLLAIQESMDDDRYTVKKPVNLVGPNLDDFSAKEISMVDAVIEAIDTWTAKKTSNRSHEWGGWKYAILGDEIPYQSVFIDNEESTLEDNRHGVEVARRHGLLDAV